MEARPNSGNPNSNKNKLAATIFELDAIRNELAMQREAAIQSWLSSKPMIDKLEKDKSEMAKSKARVSKTTAAVATLESELETIKEDIRSTRGNITRAKVRAEETTKALEEIQDEISRNQVEIDKQRLARDGIKQDFGIKKQSLRAVQLMLRAVEMEVESIRVACVGVDVDDNKQFDEVNSLVELTHDEYSELKRKAKDEASLTDWRVAVLVEQRRETERSREAAIIKLKKLYNEIERRKSGRNVNGMDESDEIKQESALDDGKPSQPRYGCNTKKKGKIVGRKARTQCIRSRKCTRKEASFRKKRPSIFKQLRSLLKGHCKMFFR